jgi:transcriptional regulator with XRE-family HTH domain
MNSLCRRCHKALESDEPELIKPAVVEPVAPTIVQPSGLQVAKTVRDIRRGKALSQRQLANRMQVPRTYISKIENGKAMPTLSSLQRLATALEVDICALLQDARSQKQQEAALVMADPFLAEISLYVTQMDAYQRSMFLNQTRDMAMGRRRTA